MMKRYKVTIANRGNVPGLGRGPFMRPILISEERYNHLAKLGYNIHIVADLLKSQPKEVIAPKTPEIIKSEVEIPSPKSIDDILPLPKKVEVKEETPVVEQELITEEQLTDAIVEEVQEISLINNPDISQYATQSVYTEDFLKSKNVCKKILNARMVQYEDNATFAFLKELVFESNPVAEEETVINTEE